MGKPSATFVFTEPVPDHWETDAGTEMANRYLAMPRSRLALGHRSDLDVANAIFMADRGSLSLIGLQTAAKERIRWLSAQLARSQAELSALQAKHPSTSNTDGND